jgi:hypothetical protein
MKRHEEYEQQMKEILQSFPSISDHRTKEEVYDEIQKRRQEPQISPTKRFYFIPSFAVVAVLVLCFVTWNVLVQNDPHYNISEDGAESKSFEQTVSEEMEGKKFSIMAMEEPVKSIYDDSQTIFTFGLLTPDQLVVPISIIGSNESSWFQQFQILAKKIPEEELGFQPLYSSELISFKQPESEKVQLHMKVGSFTERQVIDVQPIYESLNYTFADSNIRYAEVVNDEAQGESIVQQFSINNNQKSSYYIYQLGRKSYLVPMKGDYSSLQSVIQSMKHAPRANLQPTLPEHVQIKIQPIDKNTISLIFQPKVDLTILPYANAIHMIESLLLAAKQFGYQFVSFENITPKSWDNFQFREPVAVPKAPNGITLHLLASQNNNDNR